MQRSTHPPTAIPLLRLAVPGGVSDSRDDQRDASRAPTAAASMAAIVMAFCCHGPLGRAAGMPQRGLMEVPTPRDESAQPMSTVPRTRMKDRGVAGLVAIEIPERVTEVAQIEIHPQGRLRS